MTHHRDSLLRDCFGQSYQLVLGFEPPHPAAQRKAFWCPELTKGFLRGFGAPVDFWQRLLGSASHDLRSCRGDIDVIDAVARRLIQGALALYEFPALGQRALRDGKGSVFSFVKGPDPFPTDKECLFPSNKSEADHYLAGLHAKPSFWHDLLREVGLLPEGVHPQKTSEGEYRAIVSRLLVSRELLLYTIQDIPATPKSGGGGSSEDAAAGPGNRTVPLAPQTKPEKGPDSANSFLSQDAAAKAALNEANPKSIKDNLEYGGLIYRDKTTGQYGYTGPIKGSDQGVNPFSEHLPPDSELVGDYHTHGDYSVVDKKTGAAIRTSDPRKDDFNSDDFSRQDIKGIAGDGKGINGYRGYLGTPSGNFKVYDPSTSQITLLK